MPVYNLSVPVSVFDWEEWTSRFFIYLSITLAARRVVSNIVVRKIKPIGGRTLSQLTRCDFSIKTQRRRQQEFSPLSMSTIIMPICNQSISNKWRRLRKMAKRQPLPRAVEKKYLNTCTELFTRLFQINPQNPSLTIQYFNHYDTTKHLLKIA